MPRAEGWVSVPPPSSPDRGGAELADRSHPFVEMARTGCISATIVLIEPGLGVNVNVGCAAPLGLGSILTANPPFRFAASPRTSRVGYFLPRLPALVSFRRKLVH